MHRRSLLTAAALSAIPLRMRAAMAQNSESGISKALIGKLEGADVVVDPAQWPTQLQDAPMLAGRGLPSVRDRIGLDPLVIKPVHEIGRYGGTWRQGFTGPGDVWNAWRAATGPDSLLAWDWTGNRIVPNIAKTWKVSEDGKVTTLELRRGMRWSDGHPFTADDFLFWFQDVLQRRAIGAGQVDLLPRAMDSLGGLEKIDDHTINLTFPVPNFILPDLLAGTDEIGGHAMNGRLGYGLFAPAHYMKQFLPQIRVGRRS